MKGWKTIVVSGGVIVLGILESQGITSIVASHPGGFATAVGIVMAALRWVTTSPIFTAP